MQPGYIPVGAYAIVEESGVDLREAVGESVYKVEIASCRMVSRELDSLYV